jgi:hypothetical protein
MYVETRQGQINTEHRLAWNRANEAMTHAIRCGELLAKKKAELMHGEVMPWIQQNCDFSQATANNYMKAAKSQQLGISAIRHLYDAGAGIRKIGADSTDALANLRSAWANASEPARRKFLKRVREDLLRADPAKFHELVRNQSAA